MGLHQHVSCASMIEAEIYKEIAIVHSTAMCGHYFEIHKLQ